MDSDLRDLERHGHEDQQVNHGCGSLLERSRNPDPSYRRAQETQAGH